MATPMSGQKTVTTAGTEVALADSQVVAGPVMVKALPAITGLVYIGNDGAGAVSSTTGLPLAAGESVTMNLLGNLADSRLDAAVNGEGVAWLIL